MLDTSQLAFLTSDPGLIQQKIQDAITTYHKQKKTIHGVPNQMDTGQVWSRYMSEAQQLKIEDLTARIKNAEKDFQDQQKRINSSLFVPKSITLNELHNCKSGTTRSVNPGRDLNVVLTNASPSGNLDVENEDKVMPFASQERKKPSTSYGTRRRTQNRNEIQ